MIINVFFFKVSQLSFTDVVLKFWLGVSDYKLFAECTAWRTNHITDGFWSQQRWLTFQNCKIQTHGPSQAIYQLQLCAMATDSLPRKQCVPSRDCCLNPWQPFPDVLSPEHLIYSQQIDYMLLITIQAANQHHLRRETFQVSHIKTQLKKKNYLKGILSQQYF